jgi:hypothetical protein
VVCISGKFLAQMRGVPLGLPNMNNSEAVATASFTSREIVDLGAPASQGLMLSTWFQSLVLSVRFTA